MVDATISCSEDDDLMHQPSPADGSRPARVVSP
jgi:hypothetical protein